ncbi:MAG TPA: NAD(P)-binding domain-containing protein [Candidatus Babeliales bacterium]|nr:NAD(P)-binding domain-containing protein [Candidatus Babeliales bacterium]
MKIGILGSGDVAKSLARGFLSRRHEVMLGTRDAAKLAPWQKEQHAGAQVGSFAQTAAFGEIVALATLGTATISAIEQAGPQNFAGKVVIDTTNPLNFGGKTIQLAIGFDDSLGERVQRALPKARVVKAFNTVGNQYFVDPQFDGGPPTMFIAGNDDAAKTEIIEILQSFGWESADLGGIESSRYLEPMCMAWLAYGARSGTWHHAFKLLR